MTTVYRSRDLEREFKTKEFKSFGKRYDPEPEDFREDLKRQIRTLKQGDQSNLELESEARRRDRQRGYKERQKRIERRKVEYDYEIKGWAKDKPFNWQKSYIEKEKEEKRNTKRELYQEQEKLVAQDKKWERGQYSREDKRHDRREQLDREALEHERQIEELKIWKKERQEKLERRRQEISEKYEKISRRFDQEIQEKINDVREASIACLTKLKKSEIEESRDVLSRENPRDMPQDGIYYSETAPDARENFSLESREVLSRESPREHHEDIPPQNLSEELTQRDVDTHVISDEQPIAEGENAIAEPVAHVDSETRVITEHLKKEHVPDLVGEETYVEIGTRVITEQPKIEHAPLEEDVLQTDVISHPEVPSKLAEGEVYFETENTGIARNTGIEENTGIAKNTGITNDVGSVSGESTALLDGKTESEVVMDTEPNLIDS